jgi:hypothetical protein
MFGWGGGIDRLCTAVMLRGPVTVGRSLGFVLVCSGEEDRAT